MHGQDPRDVEHRHGVAAGTVAYLLWGTFTIYWRELHGLDAIQLIAVRVLVAVVLLTVALRVGRSWGPLVALLSSPRGFARLAIAAGLLTVNWTSYVWAVGHERVVETALGYFIAPLFTMLIGIVKFREPVSVLQRAALALAAVALSILVVGYGTVPYIALLIGGSWAIYGMFKREVPLGPLQSLGGETMVLLVPALAVLAVAEGRGQLLTGATTAQWIMLPFAGLVTVAPLLLFARAARVVPFTILGPLNYLVPTINLLLGVLAYGESFDTVRFVGFGLVWVSLVLVALNGVRASRPALAGAR